MLLWQLQMHAFAWAAELCFGRTAELHCPAVCDEAQQPGCLKCAGLVSVSTKQYHTSITACINMCSRPSVAGSFAVLTSGMMRSSLDKTHPRAHLEQALPPNCCADSTPPDRVRQGVTVGAAAPAAHPIIVCRATPAKCLAFVIFSKAVLQLKCLQAPRILSLGTAADIVSGPTEPVTVLNSST